MLEVKSLSVNYGLHKALVDVDLTVNAGELVVILGANGAGKSTLLRAVSGVCEGSVSGQVKLAGKSLETLTADNIVKNGVVLVPEGRGIFGDLTVKENLLLGAYAEHARENEESNLQHVLDMFPKLQERLPQIARTMSGGEQQMVAIGRALMSQPKILMLDEPSLGLSPLLCKEIFQRLSQVKNSGTGILLVEQNAKQSLAIADRGYLLENTKIVHEDTASNLASDPKVQKSYLGAGGKAVTTTSATATTSAVSKPDVPPFIGSPVPRRYADQQIGISVEALVADATEASRSAQAAQLGPSVTTTAPRTTPMSKTMSSAATENNLNTVIKDIESAAQQARQRRAGGRHRPRPSIRSIRQSTANAAGVTVDSNTGDKPVVIEVYKRPRVEVYRRRPDGTHKRD